MGRLINEAAHQQDQPPCRDALYKARYRRQPATLPKGRNLPRRSSSRGDHRMVLAHEE